MKFIDKLGYDFFCIMSLTFFTLLIIIPGMFIIGKLLPSDIFVSDNLIVLIGFPISLTLLIISGIKLGSILSRKLVFKYLVSKDENYSKDGKECELCEFTFRQLVTVTMGSWKFKRSKNSCERCSRQWKS